MPKLIEAIKKELGRPATSTMDAIFLNLLKSDYESKNWKSNTIYKVKKKYGIR